MTELIPRLFIGNWHEARDAKDFHVVTVAIDSHFVGHQHFKLIDGPGNSGELFGEAVDAVVAAYAAHEKVLVHCVGGRSRSAAVIVAAAHLLTGEPFCTVYDRLLQLHDQTRVHPHLGLLLLEKCRE